MTRTLVRIAAAAIAAMSLAACGSGAGTAANNAANGAGNAMNAASGAMAAIPRNLNCRGQVVWVNTVSHAYHRAGDPYYGRTKVGVYMCEAAAVAEGDHLAGKHREGGGMMNGNGNYNNANSGYSNGSNSNYDNGSNANGMSNGSNATSSGTHHRRHHKVDTATP